MAPCLALRRDASVRQSTCKMEVLEAWVGVIGALVGGLAVLLTSTLEYRRRARSEMLQLAWENIGEIIANHRRTQSWAKVARSEGLSELNSSQLEEIADADRLQDTRVFMLPVSPDLHDALRRVVKASKRILQTISGPEDEWLAAIDNQRQAIFDTEAEMRVLLGAKDPNRRLVTDE